MVPARRLFPAVGIWYGTSFANLVVSLAALLAWRLTLGTREVGLKGDV